MERDDFLFLVRVQRDDSTTRLWFDQIVKQQLLDELKYLEERWRILGGENPLLNKAAKETFKGISKLMLTRAKEVQLIGRTRTELSQEIGSKSGKQHLIDAMPGKADVVRDCAKEAFTAMWMEIEAEVLEEAKGEDSKLSPI
jgi:hypothetical protein